MKSQVHDQETEKYNQFDKINQLGKTVLMISHKLSVLDICDIFTNLKIKKLQNKVIRNGNAYQKIII